MRKNVMVLLTVLAIFLTVTGFDAAPRVERMRIQDTEKYTIFENVTPSMASKIQAGYGLRLVTDDLDFYTKIDGKGEGTAEYLLVAGTKGNSVHYYDPDRRQTGEDRLDAIFTLTDFRISSVLGAWENGKETSFGYQSEDVITVQQGYAYADIDGEKMLVWGNGNDGWETVISREGETYILLLSRWVRNDGQYHTGGLESELQGVWYCIKAFLLDETTERLRNREEVNDFHRKYDSFTSDYFGDYYLFPEILNTYFPEKAS